ncbi:TonB-dependent receptor [Luminiphilus sp.]|nr:TonB-dependent receptor [Luminiphilus sp.]
MTLKFSYSPLAAAVLLAFLPQSLFASTIEETVVVADRINTASDALAVSVNVLDRALISALGSATLPQLLESEVGITATQTGGIGAVSGVRIRGQDGFRTKVLLDGVDISDPSSPQIGPRMEHIVSNSLDRIEVLRGTQGLLWGADAGGVIALSSRRGSSQPSVLMSAELGGYGFQSESMVLSSGASDLGEGSISISQMTLDGFNARLDDVTLSDDDGYDNESYQLTYTTPTWRNWSATLSAREVRAETDYDLCYTASFTTSNNCRDDYQNDSQSLLLEHTGEGQSSQVRWSESNSERAYATDNTVGFSTQGKNRQISALHSRNLTNDLSLTVGIDLDEQGYDDGADQRTRDNNATFVNLRRQSERLTLSAGIRSDDNDDFGRHTSWRLTALSQTPLDNVVLKIAAGTGFRAPSPYEIGYNNGPWAYAPAADQPLSEEQSAGWELGLRDTSGALVWEITYFDQDITDAIIFDLVGYSGYVQIQGKSQSTGVEASASWQLSDRLAVGGFVSQLDADDASGAPLPYRPGLTSQLSARYTDDRSNWMLTARQTADRVDKFGGDLKDYAVVDASYAYNITNNVKLSVRAENLANQKYADIVGYRSPRRALYLGINLTL